MLNITNRLNNRIVQVLTIPLIGCITVIFKNQLNPMPKELQSKMRLVEILVLAVSIFSLIIPIVFGFPIFEDFMPFKRFLRKHLLIELKFNLPLAVVIVVFVEQLANMNNLLLCTCLLQMYTTTFWTTCITPIEQRIILEVNRRMQTTVLGKISGETGLNVYRRLQVPIFET